MGNPKSLFAYSFAHFSVDFACFYMLFKGVEGITDNMAFVALVFLIYNAIAFGLQPIIGYACDVLPQVPIGQIGCAMVVLGIVIMPYLWVSLTICALGNACFHVGGGIDSLTHSGGKMGRSGVFVSTGALGVALGTLFGKNADAFVWLPLALLLISILLIAMFAKTAVSAHNERHFNIASSKRPFAIVLLLALVSVFVRAYAGSVVPLEWKTHSVLFMILPSVGAMIGKAAGGFLGDVFGARRIGTVSLVVSIPFLLLGNTMPVVSMMGIVLFNLTMPITLCTVASKLWYSPGLAFGLTTLALLCGSVPTFFFALPKNIGSVVIAMMIMVSAGCVYLSTKNNKGDIYYEKDHTQHEQQIV